MAVSVRTLTYVLPLLHQPPPRAVVGRRSPPRFPRLVFGGPLLLLLRPLNFEPRRGDFLPFSTAKSSALSFAAFIFPFLVALRDLRVPFLVPSSSIREQLSPLTHDDSFFFCRDLGGMFDEIGVSRLDGLFLGCYLRRIALRVKL